MPARRFLYADLVREAGLPIPDETTMHFLWQIVDEGVLGASRHVELTHRLLVHIAESETDAAIASRRVALAARFVAETRGRDAPVVANAIAWLLTSTGATPTPEYGAQLAR